MNKLAHQLQQAFAALEFTDVGHLHALSAKLDALERPAAAPSEAVRDEQHAPLNGAAAAH